MFAFVLGALFSAAVEVASSYLDGPMFDKSFLRVVDDLVIGHPKSSASPVLIRLSNCIDLDRKGSCGCGIIVFAITIWKFWSTKMFLQASISTLERLVF